MSIYFPSSERDPVTAITYTYNDDGTIKKIHNGITVSSENYTYDSFGRLSSNGLKVGSSTILNDVYQYQTQGAGDAGVVITSNRVSQVTTTLPNATNEITYYTYDGAGNITCIRYYYPSNGTNKYVYYHYDNVGQLEREDNQLLGYTYTYSYDDSGNMVYKDTRNYTTAPTNEVNMTQPISWESFGRDGNEWGDRCAGYIGGGSSVAITYDEIGNPINYYNGSSYTFSWENGRRLAGVVDGSSTYSYEYNQDGIRTYKNVWGTGYEYILNGTQIMVEREYVIGSNRTVAERRYFYDANGIISSAKVYYYGYNGTTCTEFDFFFKTNIQGDVLAVYNASGTEVMKITYDAWGNFTDTVSTMSHPPSTEQLQALAIPFRYRGYVYDQETGFYYLNSRYYDPVMHKFLNADSTSYLGANGDLIGYNLYAYCGNNPVMNNDPLGLWTVSIGFNAKAYAFVGASITYSIVLDDKWNIAVQKTEVDTFGNKGAVFGVLGASAGVSYSATKCDTVFDLESASLEISGKTLGGMVDMEANEFVGITVSDSKASANAGVPGTVVVSTTETIFDRNISGFIESIKAKWNALWR